MYVRCYLYRRIGIVPGLHLLLKYHNLHENPDHYVHRVTVRPPERKYSTKSSNAISSLHSLKSWTNSPYRPGPERRVAPEFSVGTRHNSFPPNGPRPSVHGGKARPRSARFVS